MRNHCWIIGGYSLARAFRYPIAVETAQKVWRLMGPSRLPFVLATLAACGGPGEGRLSTLAGTGPAWAGGLLLEDGTDTGPPCPCVGFLEVCAIDWDGGEPALGDGGPTIGGQPALDVVLQSTPGPASSAVLSLPTGVGYDPKSKKLVVVTLDAIDQVDPSDGVVTALVATPGQSEGTCGFVVQPPSPLGACLGKSLAVAPGPAGAFVAQKCAAQLIQVLDGGVLQFVAGANQPTSAEELPSAISDGAADTVVFDGQDSDSPFPFMGMWQDPQGVLWVANTGERRIQRVSNGWVDLVAGGGGPGLFDGPGAEASFVLPRAIVGDGQGNLWVGDGAAIRHIDSSLEVTTFSGVPGTVGHKDGSAKQALFQDILGIARADDGNLYVIDGALVGDAAAAPLSSYPTLFVLFVRRVDSSGTVTTVAGNGEPSTAYRDGPALHVPVDGFFLAVDADDKHVYLTAPFANRVRVLTLP